MTERDPIMRPPAWAKQLSLSGVTGTNGKTSTTLFLSAMLSGPASPCMCMTTLGSYLGAERLPVPQSFQGMLQGMRACLDAGGRHAALEVTSETLARGFASIWHLSLGVFTNLSHDHLDAHGSAEHYFASKAQLFHALVPGDAAVINGNDEVAPLLDEVISAGVHRVVYGMSNRAPELALDLTGRDPVVSWEGTRLSVELGSEHGFRKLELMVPCIGDVFAENALAALAAAMVRGVPPEVAAERVSRSPPIPGRFECVVEAPRVVVDFAHSPDALERTLKTARTLCTGELSVVFGAGGGRDRLKRPLMGQAAMLADHLFITSDNPRHEDPGVIAEEIAEGCDRRDKVEITLDRGQAIEKAVLAARENGPRRDRWQGPRAGPGHWPLRGTVLRSRSGWCRCRASDSAQNRMSFGPRARRCFVEPAGAHAYSSPARI